MSTALTESYARGAQTPPLIEQTLGAFFADMVARQPEREALVSAHQGRRYTYASCRPRPTAWPARCWAWA
jgi:fatty-acyl-CoA synthase